MGLERVDKVWAELGLVPSFPIITVGGTNGKGSTCTMLEAILNRSGYRVGCYTSPHLLRYNERVRINRRKRAIPNYAMLSKMWTQQGVASGFP